MRMAQRIVGTALLCTSCSMAQPRFAGRHGGYLRITKIGLRHGDAALMSIVELVDSPKNARVGSRQSAFEEPVLGLKERSPSHYFHLLGDSFRQSEYVLKDICWLRAGPWHLRAAPPRTLPGATRYRVGDLPVTPQTLGDCAGV